MPDDEALSKHLAVELRDPRPLREQGGLPRLQRRPELRVDAQPAAVRALR